MSEVAEQQEASTKARNTRKVQMNDGRELEFGEKAKVKKDTIVEDNRAGVRLDFVNGESITFYVPEAFLMQAAAHGISQKLGDAMAGEKNLEDAIEAVQAVAAQIEKGDWNKQRESGGFAGASILVRALMEKSGKDKETVRAFLADKTQKEKIALRNAPSLRDIVQRLEAEQSKDSGVDADALMSGL